MSAPATQSRQSLDPIIKAAWVNAFRHVERRDWSEIQRQMDEACYEDGKYQQRLDEIALSTIGERRVDATDAAVHAVYQIWFDRMVRRLVFVWKNTK